MNTPHASGNPRLLLREARAAAEARSTAVLDELVARLGDAAYPMAESLGVSTVGQPGDVEAVERGLGLSGALPSGVIRLKDGRQLLILADPWDLQAIDNACSVIGTTIEPGAAPEGLMRQWFGSGEAERIAPVDVARTGDGQDLSAVGFVDRAILQAYQEGASDVHFECDRSGVTVKLRMDGVMTTFARGHSVQHAEETISRIKVLAQLDITERRLPQDGRFRYQASGASNVVFDLRVSIMPSIFGEDAVLRLLDKSHLRASTEQVTLNALGFAEDGAKDVRLLSNLPNGMLLVTGPTGSGKTTTVYAALSEINTGLEKIITIEDPVEYELPGVLQIPVNERKGLTFARGLRSILRHDPDRILVGEIRDAETAEIAVQSSLTGHLVFTTVHANSLFDVIGRFRHFGIDMFGFVSSLNGVIVQRLMRKLCTACTGDRPPSPDEAGWLAGGGFAHVAKLPSAVGCTQCHHTGYRGRFVIAEVHTLDDAFRDLVMRGADVTSLKSAAFSDHVVPLRQQAMRHVEGRRTTLEELFRVVGQI